MVHIFRVPAVLVCKSCPVMPVLSWWVLSCPALPCPVLSCPAYNAMPCPTLLYLILSFSASYCPVMPCTIRSWPCPVLSSLALSCHDGRPPDIWCPQAITDLCIYFQWKWLEATNGAEECLQVTYHLMSPGHYGHIYIFPMEVAPGHQWFIGMYFLYICNPRPS